MAQCNLCRTELKFSNTPLIGGTPKDGSKICTSCVRKINKANPSVVFNMSQHTTEYLRSFLENNQLPAEPKKVSKIFGVLFILAVVLIIYSLTGKEKEVVYKIVDDVNSKNEKVINVEIGQIIDTGQLLNLAKEVYDKEFKGSGNFYVFVSIKGYAKGNGSWARVDFEPEMKLGFISRSKSMNDSIKVSTSLIKGNVLAIWDGGVEHFDYALIDSAKQNLIKHIYAEGEFTVDTMYASKVENGNIKLRSQNQDYQGEYLIVNGNGDLEFYNKENKLFNVAKKIR